MEKNIHLRRRALALVLIPQMGFTCHGYEHYKDFHPGTLDFL